LLISTRCTTLYESVGRIFRSYAAWTASTSACERYATGGVGEGAVDGAVEPWCALCGLVARGGEEARGEEMEWL